MNDKKSGKKPDELKQKMHQAIIDPSTGKDITGDVASESEQDMNKEIDQILNSASTENIEETIKSINQVLKKHYHRLKIPVDEKEFEKILTMHAKKIYPEIYKDLDMIGIVSQNHGLEYSISTKPKLSFYFGWDAKISGLWLFFYKDKKLHSTLYAMPIIEMKTSSYGPYFIGGEPPAAKIIKATENMLLFSSQENAPPAEYLNKIGDVKENWNNLSLLAPKKLGSLLELEYTDPVIESAPAEHSEEEVIEEAKKDKRIKAVSFVISGYPNKKIVPI